MKTEDEDRWDFIPYNEASALQLLGFNKKCFAKIDQINCLQIKGAKSGPRGSMVYDYVDCPLYSQVFRWFRKEHGFQISPTFSRTNGYDYLITKHFDDGKLLIKMVGYKETYEEAELACIQKLIELITDNK